jgi:hypothetical protein
MVDFAQAELQQLITHHIGNKLKEENYSLSNETTVVKPEAKEYLLKYFLNTIKAEEVYSFTHPVQLYQNDVFAAIESIFKDEDKFVEASQHLAKLLYEYSVHPKILEGELNVAFFTNANLEGKKMEAIGIFKSEKNVPFLKMKNQKARFVIDHDFGFEIDKIDKGCIVFNTQKIDGYRLFIIDNASKSEEAKYWKDAFLKVKPVANEFHQTQQIMGITKDFVTKKLSEEFEVTKADKIDLLNRSVDYFKTHDSFNKKEFEKEVLQDTGIIKSFRNFDANFRAQNDIDLGDDFDISLPAVKKQARIFKSVLKLDKNFHIYIHGNRELIEQGVDKDGENTTRFILRRKCDLSFNLTKRAWLP